MPVQHGAGRNLRRSVTTSRTPSDPSRIAVDEFMDAGTGVFHEEAFRHLLTRETGRTTRYRDVFSLCLLKPDLSDNRGVGDDALRRAVSGKVGQLLRTTDLVGHLAQGIAVILLHTIGRDAIQVAERIRSNIEQVAFRESPEGPPRRVTLSVGGVSFPLEGHTETLLLSRARANLHEAVLQGGNQVVYGAGKPD